MREGRYNVDVADYAANQFPSAVEPDGFVMLRPYARNACSFRAAAAGLYQMMETSLQGLMARHQCDDMYATEMGLELESTYKSHPTHGPTCYCP